MPGYFVGAHQGCQVPFRPPIPNVGLLLRRCSGKGLHLPMTGEPRGFSRVTAGFSSYDGEFGAEFRGRLRILRDAEVRVLSKLGRAQLQGVRNEEPGVG